MIFDLSVLLCHLCVRLAPTHEVVSVLSIVFITIAKQREKDLFICDLLRE